MQISELSEKDLVNISNKINKNKDLIVKNRYENKYEEANYFKEEVRKQLNDLLGNQNLYTQGYIIKTTIDTSIQKIADIVLKEGLINQDIKNGWTVSIAEYVESWNKGITYGSVPNIS